ncbi:MAG TPA: twin-arginine translocase TatA/TatE family subunit [Candidatus Dormibacteraeota bacterium]
MGLPFHPFWLIILLAIVLIIFGPGKLPELGGAVGRGIREFRKASNEIREEVTSSVHDKEPSGAATATNNTTPTPTPATSSAADHKAEPEKKS